VVEWKLIHAVHIDSDGKVLRQDKESKIVNRTSTYILHIDSVDKILLRHDKSSSL
jgi:hypothetical protein